MSLVDQTLTVHIIYHSFHAIIGSETSLCRRDDLSDKAGSDSRLFSTSPDVCQIMEDIDAGKHSRLRKEIKEELTSIKDRVKEVILVFYIKK